MGSISLRFLKTGAVKQYQLSLISLKVQLFSFILVICSKKMASDDKLNIDSIIARLLEGNHDYICYD